VCAIRSKRSSKRALSGLVCLIRAADLPIFIRMICYISTYAGYRHVKDGWAGATSPNKRTRWLRPVSRSLLIAWMVLGLAGVARGARDAEEEPAAVPKARPYCPLCDPNADPNTWAIDAGWEAVWPMPEEVKGEQACKDHLARVSPAQRRALEILRYPYVGQESFARSVLPGRGLLEADPNIGRTVAREPGAVDSGGEAGSELAEPGELEPHPEEAGGSEGEGEPNVMASYVAIQTCCDLIHQWRCFNESAETAQEVLWALTLTKRSTGIYRLNPALAVQVRRTVGQMGRVNRRFDATSRLVLESVLQGRSDERLLSRLEKQAKDLVSLREHLAGQNDQVSTALGHGKLARRHFEIGMPEPITAAPTEARVADGESLAER